MGFGPWVDVNQQLGGPLDPLGPGSLIPAIGLSELAQSGAPLGGHRKEPGLTPVTAREDPRLVQVTLGTTAGGFDALSAQEVKGAGRHGLRGLELTQETSEGSKGSPEFLALPGQVGAQSVLQSKVTDTDSRQKKLSNQRN